MKGWNVLFNRCWCLTAIRLPVMLSTFSHFLQEILLSLLLPRPDELFRKHQHKLKVLVKSAAKHLSDKRTLNCKHVHIGHLMIRHIQVRKSSKQMEARKVPRMVFVLFHNHPCTSYNYDCKCFALLFYWHGNLVVVVDGPNKCTIKIVRSSSSACFISSSWPDENE